MWPIAEVAAAAEDVVDMGDVDLHAWFRFDELEPCASCDEVAAIRLPASGSFLCLACGLVAPPLGTGEAQGEDSAANS
jgi:hypothetical protein